MRVSHGLRLSLHQLSELEGGSPGIGSSSSCTNGPFISKNKALGSKWFDCLENLVTGQGIGMVERWLLMGRRHR